MYQTGTHGSMGGRLTGPRSASYPISNIPLTRETLISRILNGGLRGNQPGNDQCCPYTIAASAARSSVRSAIRSPFTAMLAALQGKPEAAVG